MDFEWITFLYTLHYLPLFHRSWRTDLPKGACVLISTSIDHEGSELLGGIRGVELASRYLIEPCGTGKSRLTHISRVDMRFVYFCEFFFVA